MISDRFSIALRLALVLCLPGMISNTEAHSGSRVYPFYELTDEMLKKIDIHDGTVDEWYEIGEPSMTLLDFKTVRNHVPHDPSNLDFKIWLAWHEELNRIYVAVIVADDEYKDTGDSKGARDGDGIHFYLDADHNGGRGFVDGWEMPFEDMDLIFGQTQRYGANPRVAGGPNFAGGGRGESWRLRPPYGDAGGGAAGENPTIWIIEMYVTPFNQWGYEVEDTAFSELSAHLIVGFALVIYDRDPSKGDVSTEWNPEAIKDDDALHRLRSFLADIFLDGLLVPAQETAVESLTWGRIKASVQ